jgi:hypothetical protein
MLQKHCCFTSRMNAYREVLRLAHALRSELEDF